MSKFYTVNHGFKPILLDMLAKKDLSESEADELIMALISLFCVDYSKRVYNGVAIRCINNANEPMYTIDFRLDEVFNNFTHLVTVNKYYYTNSSVELISLIAALITCRIKKYDDKVCELGLYEDDRNRDKYELFIVLNEREKENLSTEDKEMIDEAFEMAKSVFARAAQDTTDETQKHIFENSYSLLDIDPKEKTNDSGIGHYHK